MIVAAAAVAGERERVADLEVALRGLAGEPQLRALEVEQQAERLARALGRVAHGLRAPQQVLGAAV